MVNTIAGNGNLHIIFHSLISSRIELRSQRRNILQRGPVAFLSQYMHDGGA
jgi:hypothetical protein